MKKILSCLLIFMILISLLTNTYLSNVYAEDLDDGYVIITEGDNRWLLGILKDLGIVGNDEYITNVADIIRSYLLEKGYIVSTDGHNYFEKNFYNGDKLNTTIDLLNDLNDLIREYNKQRDPIIYVSGKLYNDYFNPNMRYLVNKFTYSSSMYATYNLLENYRYSVYSRAYGVANILFWVVDTNCYKYAYLDDKGYIRFVDNDLNPSYCASFYKGDSNFTYTKQFSYDDLLLDFTNNLISYDGRYRMSDTSKTISDNSIDMLPSVDDEGNYYIYNMYGTMPVFASLTDLMNYIGSHPDYYLTENFYNRNYSNTTVTNVTNYTNQNMQNTYNTIVQGSQDAVTAEEMQNIIDEAVKKLIDSMPDDSGGSSSSTTVNVDLTETNNLLSKIYDQLFNIFKSVYYGLDEIKAFLNQQLSKLSSIDSWLESIDSWLESIDRKLDDLIDGIVEGITGGTTLYDLYYAYKYENPLQEIIDNNFFEDVVTLLDDSRSILEYIRDDIAADFKSTGEKLDNLVKYCKSIDSKLSVLIGLETVDLINDLFGDDEDKDLSGLSGSFTALDTMKNKFPFSLPYEIYAVINLFASDPVVPVFNVPFQYELFGYSFDYQMTIDLTDYQWLSDYSRSILAIVFIVGLYKFTLLYVIKK